MKKFIIFLFLFVLLFSSFSYSQIEQTSSSQIGEVSSSQIVETSSSSRGWIKWVWKIGKEVLGGLFDLLSTENSALPSFMEKNAELFKSEEEAYTLFNNIKNNPEIMSVLDNNPELVNTINENPQLFFNVLLDDQELKSFINNPTEYTSKGWLDGMCKLPILRIEEVSKKSTVELWQDWGIMK